MNYEDLAQAFDDSVMVFERDQLNDGYYADGIIAIKDTLTNAEKHCTLAEELGHHFTSFGNILNHRNVKNVKQENIARRWAYRRLIPLDAFIKAFEERRLEKYDLIEYLEVTEEFLDATIKYYKVKYGEGVEYKNYTILFEPCFSVIKWMQR